MVSGEEIATIIGAGLGLIGALLIIIIFLYFKENKLFYRKLVFILSIYDLLESITYLLPGNSEKILCKIQYYLIAIFTTTPQFWSATISFISYLKVVKEFDDKKLNKIHKWFHLIMIIPIIVLIIIVGYSHDYNKSKTYWCTSTNEAFIIIIKFISKEFSSTTRINQMNQIWIQIRMSLIPLIEILIAIPPTIRRLREIIKPSASDIPTLDFVHSLLASSQGFWDFWIFIVFDPEMRKKTKNCFCCSTSTKLNKFQDLEPININDQLIKKKEIFNSD
ncbi:g-protein coupled receptor 157 [Anaeramoeba ignava]|uniref:G-protein coupled receptor 157 n=1 Tax=Anaeramoeba ignava TaxID=1746090 RepID=A0A9Q0LW34_ANAIG|nr:g-protein coupled receptor 157 [Anaeramoeba ignava]